MLARYKLFKVIVFTGVNSYRYISFDHNMIKLRKIGSSWDLNPGLHMPDECLNNYTTSSIHFQPMFLTHK